MHSYIYQNEESIKDLTANTQIIPLEITCLDDVKKLHYDLKLAQSQKTSYLLPHAQLFSSVIFNSLLKILEEPNENVSFFLQTDNYHLPPTILSRCFIVKDHKFRPPVITAPNFEGWPKIQKRDQALDLLASLTYYYHSLLVKNSNLKKIATNLSLVDTTTRNIKNNGHLLLNLVNLTINLKTI